jgi:peroxiredoxin
MKNLLVWAALAAAPLAAHAQQGYTIQGKIGTLNKPAMAFLSVRTNGVRHLDSTYLKNGVFVFKGKVNEIKEAHIMLKHDDKPANPTMRQTFDVLAFFIENRDIKIIGKDSIKTAKIIGSPTNDESKQLDNYLRPYYTKLDDLNKEFASKPDKMKRDTAYQRTLNVRAEQYQKDAVQAKLTYAKAHPTSYLALVALNSTLSDDADAVAAEKIFRQLSPATQNSELGKSSLQRIQKVKLTQMGVEAPNFTLNDMNGKPVKLSDFRGKYVLLDFWASWCAPCRRENPNLLKAYSQYKDKGFTILGVALDKEADREKWLKAIEADGLTWPQVSDLKYWQSDVAKLYDVKAIPMNFLIDREGKIVAKYLRGDVLNQKLEEVLGK